MSEDKHRAPAPSNASEYADPAGATPRPGVGGLFAEGSRFGPYSIGPCIAEGRVARIYKARHEGLHRQVALKVLCDGFARNSDGRQRFLREARNAAAIKHPNVVDIFDVGIQHGMPYLVMELLEGQDLASLLAEKHALDEGTLVDVMVPVVAGLAAVHDAGVLHRNLKPANIFIARGRNGENEPKLFDFGISKALWSEELKLTLPNRLLLGTPGYMSPEAIRGAPMTALSDQYSLGVVMYECVTGINPCEGESFADTLRIITSGAYPPVSRYRPQLSRHLTGLIERAMSLDPADRFADLRELGRELLLLAGKRTRVTWDLSFGESSRALSRRAAVTTVIELAPEAHLRTRQRARRRGVVLAFAGLMTLAALGGAVFVIGNPVPGALSRQLPSKSQEPAAASVTRPLLPAAPRALEPARLSPGAGAPPAAPSYAGPAQEPRYTRPAEGPAEEHAARARPFAAQPSAVSSGEPEHRTSEPRRPQRSADAEAKANPSWFIPAQAFPPMQRVSAVRSRSPDVADEAPLPEVGTNNAPILD